MTIILDGMWDKGNTPALLVGMKTCTAVLEISIAVSQKIGNQSTSRHNDIILLHIPKGFSIILQGCMLNNIDSRIIHNSQNVDAPQLKNE